MRPLFPAALLCAATVFAQDSCPPTPTFSPCEISFEMTEQESAQNPNPYLSVTAHAEFRSPRHRTVLVPGYWDGGRKIAFRFTAVNPGEWTYRITSSVASMNGKMGTFTATESEHPGFLQVDNLRAWSTTARRQPHLWMGDTLYTFAWMERSLLERILEARAAQNFNHIRALVMHQREDLRPAFLNPDQPNVAHFQELDKRIRAANQKGFFVDLILAGDQDHLVKVLPERRQRERFLRYLIARYAPFMITWQGVQEFEEYTDGRALLNEIGQYLKQNDPYRHPRSTHAVTTSAPLLPDGWMTHIIYQSSSVPVAAVHRQIYQVPMVNAEFAYEDSGAGKSHPHHVSSDEFRRRLWRMTMNGQYPTFGNTGLYGGKAFAVDLKYLDSPGARAMKAWFDFFERTRFWELEPNFEVDGGVSLALGGIEYIVYLEKPGPVEVVTERKSYEVYWFRPATGEIIKEKKDFKGERFQGSPPDNTSDWVLHLSRDGRKESMLKSWKFASRPIFQQEPERNPQKIPFEIEEPQSDSIPVGKPVRFAAKLTRETRASKAMMYVWEAEATADQQGYRIIGDKQSGDFQLPAGLAKKYPAVVNLRLYGINANGKLYQIDRVVRAER
jgi:hypothetical protein